MMTTKNLTYVPAPRKRSLREWLRDTWADIRPHSVRDTVAMLTILELIGLAVILYCVFAPDGPRPV